MTLGVYTSNFGLSNVGNIKTINQSQKINKQTKSSTDSFSIRNKSQKQVGFGAKDSEDEKKDKDNDLLKTTAIAVTAGVLGFTFPVVGALVAGGLGVLLYKNKDKDKKKS